ncbi:MAG: secondary thiamine-phosphate synthase enzyme YjbQ [Patescibacteria group bacterium]
MEEIVIRTTKNREIIDITQEVQKLVKAKGVGDGICNLFVLHTTAAITTADLDYGTAEDFLDAFEALIPKLHYRHPHNPAHVKDHIMATLLGPSLGIPIEKGELMLGVWQRIILVELGGPRERNVVVSFSNVIK